MQLSVLTLSKLFLMSLFIYFILQNVQGVHKQLIFIFVSLLFIELLFSANFVTRFGMKLLQF